MDLEQYLRAICGVWERQITLCREAKEKQFGKTAKELWGFLGKTYRQLYGGGEEEVPFGNARNPYYKTRISKSAEAVALLVPWVLSQLPHRNIEPRRPPLPTEIAELLPQAVAVREKVDARDQMAAYLLQWFLNYTPTEYGLKREARTALPEAFVKGRGLLWHEMVESPAGMIPSSQFVSVDDLLIDSDSIKPKDAGFMIRRRRRSVWQVSEEFGIPREELRSVGRSKFQEAIDASSEKQESKDVCEYYEVYSRVGIGHWLDEGDEQFKQLSGAMGELGPHLYLVVMPGVQYPLNLRPERISTSGSIDEIKKWLNWPIPFYADMAGNPWPCSILDFYPNQSDPWSTSPLQPGLPMQIFLDHLYSFAMGRIRITSRDIWLVAEALAEAAKNAIQQGNDLTLVPVPGEPGLDFEKLFHVVQFPETNEDLFKIGAMVERAYERATGLDPLLYGAEGARQMRSAKEAGIREAHVSSRPDDYADAVEDWMSAAGAKELQATRLMVGVETVAPMFGESLPPEDEPTAVLGPMSQQWAKLIETDDPLGQPLLELAMQGVPAPFNALVEMMGEAQGIDVNRMMIPEGLTLGQEEEGENAE
jgi:hypothetical protein